MNRPCRDIDFLSRLRMADLAIDLELELAFQNKHEFIRFVDKVFPPLPRWINPQIAAETPGRPLSRYLFPV
jgi:hypothetical protein